MTKDPLDTSSGAVLAGHLNRAEAAKAVGKSPRTIKRWEQHGLPVAGYGTLKLYNIETLRSFVLNGGKFDPPPAARPGRPRKTA
jgi:hypothetical protein